MNSWLRHECMLLHSAVSSCKCHMFRACSASCIPGFASRWIAGPTETIDLGETESWEDSSAWHGFWGDSNGCGNLRVTVFPPQCQQPLRNNGIKGVLNHHDLYLLALFLGGVGIRVIPGDTPRNWFQWCTRDAPVMHPWCTRGSGLGLAGSNRWTARCVASAFPRPRPLVRWNGCVWAGRGWSHGRRSYSHGSSDGKFICCKNWGMKPTQLHGKQRKKSQGPYEAIRISWISCPGAAAAWSRWRSDPENTGGFSWDFGGLKTSIWIRFFVMTFPI